MKVKELINKLNEFDPELIVCVADWQEGYFPPSADELSHIEVRSGVFIIEDNKKANGTFLCIGRD